jgi:hypothetical protein
MDNQQLRQIQFGPNYYIDINGNVYNAKFKILKHQYANYGGYPCVMIRRPWHQKGSKYTTKMVHRLVIMYFNRFPNDNEECNHIDGNKLNYSLSNLEWVTHLQNVRHAINTGLTKEFGETHHNAKVKQQDIIDIREKLSKGVLQKHIMKEYNLSQSHVSAIKTGAKWKHL